MASAEYDNQGIITGARWYGIVQKRPIFSKVMVEKIENIPGSTSGAGSNDFLQYRSMRRRERSKAYQEELEEKANAVKMEFQRQRELNIQIASEKQNRNKGKRQKKKEKKKLASIAKKINKHQDNGSITEEVVVKKKFKTIKDQEESGQQQVQIEPLQQSKANTEYISSGDTKVEPSGLEEKKEISVPCSQVQAGSKELLQ